MPYRDGTGPFGEGPLTGRGLGNCGRTTDRYRCPRPRRGRRLGRGPGRGRGFGRGRGPVREPVYDDAPASEKEALKEELEALDEEKEAIQEMLDKLED